METFNFIASLASIVGLGVSLIVWMQVSSIKRRYVQDVQVTTLLGKARQELLQIGHYTGLPARVAIAEGTRRLKKALIHVRDLNRHAGFPQDARIEHIRILLERNEQDAEPKTGVIETARADLEGIATEVENAMEMKRK